MREWQRIIDAFDAVVAPDRVAALATVVAVQGSSYRRPGARMLITLDGQTWGGVSGGCLEQDVIRRARGVIDQNQATLCCYDTSDETEETATDLSEPIRDPGPSLGCGGSIEILIEPVSAQQCVALDRLKRLVRDRQPTDIVTVFRVGGSVELTLGAQAHALAALPKILALMDETPPTTPATLTHRLMLGGGWADLLVERLHPPLSLTLFGDGPDVAPLAETAKLMGWHVTVVGGYAVARLRSQVPHADRHISAPLDNPTGSLALDDAHGAAVVMTHNLNRDSGIIHHLMHSPLAYIGMLGTRQRSVRVLRSAGVDLASIEPQGRLFAPTGFDLGAPTPEGIAIAVVAEIQAMLSGHPGTPLRDRHGPIQPPLPRAIPAAGSSCRL